MKKTSIYIEPDLDRALARQADREGLTKAELIRRVLSREVAESKRPDLRGIGVFEGPGDVSENVDRYLVDTALGES